MNNQIANNEEPNNEQSITLSDFTVKAIKGLMKQKPGRHHKQKRNNGGFGAPKSKVKSPIHVF